MHIELLKPVSASTLLLLPSPLSVNSISQIKNINPLAPSIDPAPRALAHPVVGKKRFTINDNLLHEIY
jgi:hypothetical protein